MRRVDTRAIEAACPAGQDEREHQEQQEAPPASKADGWLGRFRARPGQAFPAGPGLAQEFLGKPSLSVAAGRLDGMDSDDEQLLRGRVYGHDADDPHPGPRPGRAYAELVGGPLDGLLFDITGCTQDGIDTHIPPRLGSCVV
ncbi:hypothetical protein [Streptomyces graminofaciens]|uniref:hypothetical protein n=1 Tax=Streptomyces graminofaciens TaxID=68212 RepID=UPI002572DDE6|nr:hypothetical protein [Streptomyces graminofaciens]